MINLSSIDGTKEICVGKKRNISYCKRLNSSVQVPSLVLVVFAQIHRDIIISSFSAVCSHTVSS